jgi:hypothetical protein
MPRGGTLVRLVFDDRTPAGALHCRRYEFHKMRAKLIYGL